MTTTALTVSLIKNPKTGKFRFVVNTPKKHYMGMKGFTRAIDAYGAAFDLIREKNRK